MGARIRRKHGLPRDEYLARNREFCKHGTDLPQSKLDADMVRQIRADAGTHSQRQLAKRYQVHQTTIHKILTYTTWVHVL